jgi:beta-glucosidase
MKDVTWQRLKYMHGLPLHGNTRITASSEHIELSRIVARDGMVLLKNNADILPLKEHSHVALFGKAQADYVKGGGGSGDVTVSHVISVIQGLKQKEHEGKIHLFPNTSAYYESYVDDCYQKGMKPGRVPEPELPEELVKKARSFSDTALIILSRYSRESYDRTGLPLDGDYFLDHKETALIDRITSTFPTTIVVLNVGGIMDTSWFNTNSRIQGALLAGQAGMVGGLAIADILVGDYNPSGHLASTMAMDFSAYPSSHNFNESDTYVEYDEDIYVGYRYFETIPGAKKTVCYPFGFGLSYTKFDIVDTSASLENGHITVHTKVTNSGQRQGRTVLQVYCEAPQGKLGKPSRVLTAFAKTKELAPGETESVHLLFSLYSFSSYDDEGIISRASYVLEEGTYNFYIGQNVRDAEPIQISSISSGQIHWKKADSSGLQLISSRILQQLTNRCSPRNLSRRLSSAGKYIPVKSDITSTQDQDDILYPADGTYPQEATWAIPRSSEEISAEMQFENVYSGNISLDDFIHTLTDEEKIHLLCGQPNRGIANTFGMGNLPHKGVPNVMTADGPAGLRFKPEVGVTTTAFPCASHLACTWDQELLYQVGYACAEEAYENGIGIWLSPAINIQRNPLCGRNFEYYSEDPILTGKLASSLIQGIQDRGVAASLKHFACNNKETNRRESDSRLSERALREIYLKAFEICVAEAKPWTIMSSYNIINGVRASSNKDLLTHILREEWGFDGLVTTDWYTHCEQWKEINAGNDIKMGAGTPEFTLEKLRNNQLSREALNTSVRRILQLILRLS